MRARNSNAACGSKNAFNDKDISLKVHKDENSVMENAVKPEVFTENVSSNENEPNKGRSNEFLTDDIIVHTKGSQKTNDQVSEMIEIKEGSKGRDSSDVIECS